MMSPETKRALSEAQFKESCMLYLSHICGDRKIDDEYDDMMDKQNVLINAFGYSRKRCRDIYNSVCREVFCGA